MGYFVAGWFLIGVGIIGFCIGQLFIIFRKKKMIEILKMIQEEGK